ncbi:MAG: hypothetical protein E7341_00560 [Clostridiales bacterium]|nr:hypothetical protein [Clostridiales bacterium]
MSLLIEVIMGRDKVFDVEEYVKKATSFHEDKDRAEKLSTKVGYLNSLCESLEEKVFFRAVYEELFPEDKITIDLLDRLINGAFKEEKDEWMFQEIDTFEELDTFSKNLKKRVKSILKQLQRHQLAQIDRMRKRNREQREREEKFIKERDEKYNANVKDAVDKDRLLYDLKRLSVEDRRKLLAELSENPRGIIQENDLYGIKGLTDAQKKRMVGKTVEQLDPEIRRLLEEGGLFRDLGGPLHHKKRDLEPMFDHLDKFAKRRHHEPALRDRDLYRAMEADLQKSLKRKPNPRETQKFIDAYKNLTKNGPHLDGPPQLGKSL